MTVFDDFLVRAVLASIGVAVAGGLLGPFLLWRRMAFFGDATAHAALLGVALGVALQLPVMLAVLVVAMGMALAVAGLRGRTQGTDTMLAVSAHGALGVGLLALAALPGRAIRPEAWLFGDILAVGKTDLAVIWGGAILLGGLMLWRWQRLLTATLNPDLASADGIDARREGRVFTLALAVAVAIAIQVVGALLITALLILPAAAARPLARTPEAMAVLAVVIGIAAALGGLSVSWQFDTPAGPAIVSTALGLFIVTTLWRRLAG